MPKLKAKTYQMLLVEDRQDIRQEIRAVISGQPDIELRAVVGSVAEALAALNDSLDLILLDLGLPDGTGHEVIRAAKALRAEVKIVVYTVFADDANTLSAVEAGADAYLLKGAEDIAEQLRRTLRGEHPIASGVTQHLLRQLRGDRVGAAAEPSLQDKVVLTPRERDTLTALAQGMSYQEIADSLRISSHTLTDYSKSLYRKLGVHSRAEAVLHGVRLGLVSF